MEVKHGELGRSQLAAGGSANWRIGGFADWHLGVRVWPWASVAAPSGECALCSLQSSRIFTRSSCPVLFVHYRIGRAAPILEFDSTSTSGNFYNISSLSCFCWFLYCKPPKKCVLRRYIASLTSSLHAIDLVYMKNGKWSLKNIIVYILFHGSTGWTKQRLPEFPTYLWS